MLLSWKEPEAVTQELTAEVIWSKLNILKTTSGILVDDFGSKPVNGNV